MLSLMETAWVLCFNRQNQPDSQMVESLLYLIISYCHLGKSAEQLFIEDQNAFMVMFRNTDDDLLTSISIRMSTVDFFENCLFEHGNLSLPQI